MSINLGGMQSIAALTGTIDYSQIISQLYQANRAPGDALNQQIQGQQAKSNNWGQIASLAGSLQSALVTLAAPSTFSSFTTAIANTGVASVASASASTGVTPGNYSITVQTAGKPATFTSFNGAAGQHMGANVTTSTQVSQLVWSQPVTTGNITVTMGGTSAQLSVNSTYTLSQLQSDINTKLGASVALSVNANGQLVATNNGAQAVTFGSSGDTSNFLQTLGLPTTLAAGASTQTNPLGHVQVNEPLQSANFASPVSGAGALTINGVQISYNPTSDTLQSVMTAINTSTAGVVASYNPINDTMTLTSNTSQPITVSDTGTLAQALGISGTSSAGADWTYQITMPDGTTSTQTSASATVSNVIPGISFTLAAPPSGQTSGASVLTVSQNTTALTNNVNAFVTAFNSLYSQLQSDTSKGASLQGDAAMAQLGFKYMSDALSTNLPGVPTQYAQNSLMDIGISNGAIGSAPGTTNSLQVDPTKLVAQFQNNPTEVISLLTGVANKLNQDLTNVTGQINNLTPLNQLGASFVGIAQQEQNMYASNIKSIEQEQQHIYDMATTQEQLMQSQFSQLQQYQSQMALQTTALKALTGVSGG